MTGPRLRGWAGAALLVLLASSCGGASPEVAPPAAREPLPERIEVPGFFLAAPTNIVATASHLLGLTGARDLGDGVPTVRGRVVELATGRVDDVEPPTLDGAPVDARFVAADDELVLALGRTCPRFADGEEICIGGSPASLTFDPATGDWTSHPLPEAAFDPSEQWSVTALGVRSSGSFYAVVTHGRGLGTSTALTFTIGGGWAVLARDVARGSTIAETCATRDHLFVLHRPFPFAAEPDTDPVVLERIDLATGRGSAVDLPPLATAFGAAGVQFTCGPDAPVVSSSQPALPPDVEAVAPSAYRLVDGSWVAVPMDELFSIPSLMVSTALGGLHGVVLSGVPPAPVDPEQPRGSVSIGRGGVIEHLPPDLPFGGREPLWRGLSGDLLLVIEEGGSAVRRVEVFS